MASRRCPDDCRCIKHLRGLTPWDYLESHFVKVGSCWFWRKRTGAVAQRRPMMMVHGRSLPVSRFVLETTLGEALGTEFEPGHTCDNEWCVRPDHLFKSPHTEPPLP